jgi:hypothetical protein
MENKEEFVNLVNKGLSFPNVKHDKLVYIASNSEEDSLEIEANIVGLALIGSVGVEKTLELAQLAFNETNGEMGLEEGSVTTEINKLLGIETAEAGQLVFASVKKPIENVLHDLLHS